MKDKLFLIWLHERLRTKHRENEDFDFMNKLRAVINEYPEDKVSTKSSATQIKTEFGER